MVMIPTALVQSGVEARAACFKTSTETLVQSEKKVGPIGYQKSARPASPVPSSGSDIALAAKIKRWEKR